jgi:importin-7
MGDEESITSEDSDIEEELGYISPLDTVDPYLAFKQALTSEIYLPLRLKTT